MSVDVCTLSERPQLSRTGLSPRLQLGPVDDINSAPTRVLHQLIQRLIRAAVHTVLQTPRLTIGTPSNHAAGRTQGHEKSPGAAVRTRADRDSPRITRAASHRMLGTSFWQAKGSDRRVGRDARAARLRAEKKDASDGTASMHTLGGRLARRLDSSNRTRQPMSGLDRSRHGSPRFLYNSTFEIYKLTRTALLIQSTILRNIWRQKALHGRDKILLGSPKHHNQFSRRLTYSHAEMTGSGPPCPR